MDAHHRRNRYPPAPDPDRLNAIRDSYTTSPPESSPSESGTNSDSATETDDETTDDEAMTDVETNDAANSSDASETGSDAETDPDADTDTNAQVADAHKHKGKLRNVKGKGPGKGGEGTRARAPRNSKCGTRKRVNFTQLQAYPGQWRSVLEDAKARNRCTTTIETGFPTRRVGLKQAEDCLVEAMASHKAEGGVVEAGMCQFLYIHHTLNVYCKGIIPNTNLI